MIVNSAQSDVTKFFRGALRRHRPSRTLRASGLRPGSPPFQRLHQATRGAAASQNRYSFLVSRLPEHLHHVVAEEIGKQNK
jgi:hypothetical protein